MALDFINEHDPSEVRPRNAQTLIGEASLSFLSKLSAASQPDKKSMKYSVEYCHVRNSLTFATVGGYVKHAQEMRAESCTAQCVRPLQNSPKIV